MTLLCIWLQEENGTVHAHRASFEQEPHLYADVLIPQQGGDAGDKVVAVLYAPAVRHHLVCTTSLSSSAAQQGRIRDIWEHRPSAPSLYGQSS